jgi:oligopeptide transport system permease protein
VRTARAKGLPEWRVVCTHALRGGLLPVLTFLGPACAGLVTGSFVVEQVFWVPGLGRYFVSAAFDRDYNVIMGTAVFYAVLIVSLNLVVDLLHAMFDPRVRDAQA